MAAAILALLTAGYSIWMSKPMATRGESDKNEPFLFPFLIGNDHWITMHNVSMKCELNDVKIQTPDSNFRLVNDSYQNKSEAPDALSSADCRI